MTGHVTDPAQIRDAWDDDDTARSYFTDTLAVVHARHAAIRDTYPRHDDERTEP
ncbi:hypothetical protein KMZ30_07455 [Phycicoccus sp. KQZ13P-1]|uniref:hypothetical protein n=1 Tax=Phycicoccus mangrovi TaxID=2840470 RepID=UPI001BFFF3A3|nr:hypothetical protein [Phycicoccus mangrovi]MBT9255408.1 hypothetical protein [Phycicoccus mangrovi]